MTDNGNAVTPARRPVVDEGMPEIMSMVEVAELFGVSKQAVHKMIMRGKLPARQAGTTWVIRREVAEGITVDGDVLEQAEGLADRAAFALASRGVTDPAAIAQVRASAFEVAAAARAESLAGADWLCSHGDDAEACQLAHADPEREYVVEVTGPFIDNPPLRTGPFTYAEAQAECRRLERNRHVLTAQVRRADS